MKEIYDIVAEDSIKGAGIILMLVISWKIFKMKSASELESNCCEGFHFKSQTSNEGGGLHINTENNNNTDNNV